MRKVYMVELYFMNHFVARTTSYRKITCKQAVRDYLDHCHYYTAMFPNCSLVEKMILKCPDELRGRFKK